MYIPAEDARWFLVGNLSKKQINYLWRTSALEMTNIQQKLNETKNATYIYSWHYYIGWKQWINACKRFAKHTTFRCRLRAPTKQKPTTANNSFLHIHTHYHFFKYPATYCVWPNTQTLDRLIKMRSLRSWTKVQTLHVERRKNGSIVLFVWFSYYY